MTAWAIVIPAGILLALANGANDNFKGVATLHGSRTASYRTALLWATATTLLGSVLALYLAHGLLAAFSGKGLVPAETLADPVFPAAVGLAAAGTVLLATRLGFPISTTHALIGALVGAGLVASPQGVDPARLVHGFALPLLVSPLLAVAGAALLYPPLRFARRRLGVTEETCVCVGNEVVGAVPGRPGEAQALRAVPLPSVHLDVQPHCEVRYRGEVLGINARAALDGLHFLSAGTVSFARGLNDTPKIAALLLVGGALTPGAGLVAVAVFMALGGLIAAARVADTMAHRVTDMNPGQGFTANFVTTLLVIGASRLGVPVSTTHVSCGSLFGMGAVTGQAHGGVIRNILLAWVVTLPVAGGLAAGAAWILPGVL